MDALLCTQTLISYFQNLNVLVVPPLKIMSVDLDLPKYSLNNILSIEFKNKTLKFEWNRKC